MFEVRGGENELRYAGEFQYRCVVGPQRLCRYKDTSIFQVSLMGSPAGKYILAVEAPSSAPAVRAVNSSPGDESRAT
jgi:hypothetical protein